MAKNQRAGWRKAKTRPVVTPSGEFGQRGREGRKLLFRVSMLVTFAVALVVMLSIELLQRPDLDVPLILSVVSKSDARTPSDPLYTAPNPYAAEDVDYFKAWFGGGPQDPSQNVRVIGDLADATGAMGFKTGRLIKAITKPLETAEAGGPGGDMIAIYLSAGGFVDQGTAYLAVGGSRADDDASWIEFDKLLKAINDTLNDRDDSTNVHVVLFIDAARVGPQWEWGIFADSFAQACQSSLSGPTQRLAVILSASPGERSWWDPRKGRGLFPEAIVQALTGQGDKDGDGIVTVGEIEQHLRDQVGRTAEAIWDAKQTPLLVNKATADWDFISQPESEPEPSFTPVEISNIAGDFESNDALWSRHNALKNEIHTPLAFDPLGWAALERKLSRLDALVLAGTGYRGEYSALRNECENDLSEFERGPKSLPSPATLGELAIQDYFFKPPERTPEFQEMVTAWEAKPEIAAVQLPLTEATTTRFLWPWLTESGLKRDQLALAAELLQEKSLVTRDKPAQLLESFWIRFFSAPDLGHANPRVFQTILESQTLSRKAVCAGDLRALFWIRDRLQVLDQSRGECVDRMLSKDADEVAAGEDRWARRVRPELVALAERARRISDAYQLRDEMLHAIPRIAETLLFDVAAFKSYEQIPDTRSQRLVLAATQQLAHLIVALRLPSRDDPRPMEDLEESVFEMETNARQAFDALTRRLTDRQGEAIGSKAEDARGLRQTYALLVGSGTEDHQDRKRVHNKLVEILRQAAPATGTVQATSAGGNEQALADALNWSTIEGQPVWDAWLNLTRSAERGFRPSTDISIEDAFTAKPPNELVASFENAGSRLRAIAKDLQSGKLTEKFSATELLQTSIAEATDGAELEAIRRELAVWDSQVRARTFLFSFAPVPTRRIGEGRFAIDQQLFLYDHADRSMNEFWCQPRSGDPLYFSNAAGRYLATRHQNTLFSRLPPVLGGRDLNKRLADLTELAMQPTTLAPRPTEQNRSGTLLKFVAGKQVDFDVLQPNQVPTGYASFWGRYGDDRQAIRVGGQDADEVVALRVPKTMPTEANAIVAGLFFRGLRRSGEISLNRLEGGKKTVFRLPRYDAPSVRVERDQTEPERLLIVMDCSKSMVLYPSNQPRKRLDDAKEAVTQFIQNLQGDYEVGLILLGDRFGFEERGGKVVNDGKRLHVVERSGNDENDAGWLRGNEREDHNPNLDVRLALPLNPLNPNQRRAVLREIKSLGGIGTTPTYRALLKAYSHLGNRSGHVILLTDGEPKTITMDGAPLDDRVTDAQRIVDSRRKDIHLTIVKYQFRKGDILKRKFPSATILEAATGPDLLKHLESIRSNPEVTWERNRIPASEKGKFLASVPVEQWPPQGTTVRAGQPVQPAEPYSIRVRVNEFDETLDVSSDVTVEGGEEFALLLSDSQLRHQPFDYEYAAMTKINPKKADAGRYLVHVGPKAERQNRQLTLQIALERASRGMSSGDFTPRPSDIWVELTALRSNDGNRRSNTTYVFALPEFEMRQPIPILLNRIDDFPERFDKIETKAWFRFAGKPLSGIDIPIGTAESFTSEELPGVSFRTERSTNESAGIRLTVTEQYSAERKPGTLRVLPTPLPDRASTVVYEDKGVVVRTFDFDDAEASFSLSACDHELIKENSSLFAQGVVDLVFD
ncbi:MAG: vWA domain-containing protein [Planctomycetota bacterium]